MVKPRDHHVFFGAMEGSRLTGMMGLGYRMARLSKSAREVLLDGAYRDWKEIEAWADGIAKALASSVAV